MKCTLRKVEQGVVATIDERPKFKDLYYQLEGNNQIAKRSLTEDYYYGDTDHKVIASTFKIGVKELIIKTDLKNLSINKQLLTQEPVVNYTETDTQIIVQL